MKLAVNLFLSTVFLLLTSMTCYEEFDDCYEGKVDLLDYSISNANYEGKYPLKSDDSIKKEAYVIAFESDVIVYDRDSDTVIISAPESNKYVHIPYFSNVKNSGIKIYCNTDFDDNTPAGSDVTSYFKGDYIYNGTKRDYYYVLRQMPKAGIHSFNMKVELTNDSIIEKNTTPILLY